tara:strand:- start:120 stop:797 length:678 start_codon:yes stop_codon:yes gene_type:complete
VTKDAKKLTDFILMRLSETSGLFQLFSYFCDVVVVNADSLHYYFELPIDYVLKGDYFKGKDFFIIYFKYGFKPSDDVFGLDRVQRDSFYGFKSKFLHPVLEYYPLSSGKKPDGEQHALCLCGKWESISILTKDYFCSECTGKKQKRIKNTPILTHHVTENTEAIYQGAYYSVPLFRYLSTILTGGRMEVENDITRESQNGKSKIDKVLEKYSNKNLSNKITAYFK